MTRTVESNGTFWPRHIAVIGSGYVGLTLSTCLASLGHRVHCTDRSIERVGRLAAGKVPIVEEGLPELLADALAGGRLEFGVDNVAAVRTADFVFLCLPTPEGADGQADLGFVLDVAREIGPHLHPGTAVITKSTVPVGTSAVVETALGREDVHVVSNPEFLAEGSAVRDCLEPDRVVVGARHPEIAEAVAALYGPHVRERWLITDLASAELVKYASNAYLATRLTFVNSMAVLCEAVGADIRPVVAGMGADTRIGPAFLRPGPGWGGSCFPKDTIALARTAAIRGCPLELVETAISVNEQHIQRMVERSLQALGDDPRGKTVAVWGLTFKAGTDDLRQSPAVEIARSLAERGVTVHAYDPTVSEPPVPGVFTHRSPYEAVSDADLLIVATEWPEFARADLAELAERMRRPIVFDTRNVLDAEAVERQGLVYMGLGLPSTARWAHVEQEAVA